MDNNVSHNHQYVQRSPPQSDSQLDHEDVIITNSVSQAGESSPQLYIETEHESVIRTDNAPQEKESPHQSYSQQKFEM